MPRPGQTATRIVCTGCLSPGAHDAVDVCGVDIDVVTIDQAVEAIRRLQECDTCHVAHQISVDPILHAGRSAPVRDALARASLNIPDSTGVTWSLRRLGSIRVARIPGTDLMNAVFASGVEDGVTHALVGSTPETLQQLASTIRARFPGVRITDTVAPPFRAVTERGVTDDVGALGSTPDVLWVGLGTPKQQLWADLARRHEAARVIVTVGAAFDFVAGTRSRGPVAMQDVGLEWLYRLGAEPRRLWRRYLLGNPEFLWRVERHRRRTRPATR